MSDRDAVDRFKFNLLMWSGLLWTVVSGGCSAWWVIGGTLYEWQHQNDLNRPYGYGMFTYALIVFGPYFLLPGLLAWHWGKRRAGYDFERDIRSPLWQIPQVIGIAWAIACWVQGALLLSEALAGVLDGSCTKYWRGCGAYLYNRLIPVLLAWLPGWILYWASTRR